jgi:hypothetical protein
LDGSVERAIPLQQPGLRRRSQLNGGMAFVKTRSRREPGGSSVQPDLSLRVESHFRVSIPSTSRLIGLAQPPRPRPLRAGPRGPVDGVVPRVNVAPSSLVLCSRVRSISVAILSRLRARSSLRSTFAPTASREALHTRAHLYSPAGPCDACQCPLARPSRAALRQLADRPGLPLPALLAACTCQPCFMLDRPWAPHPSEASPRSRRHSAHMPVETSCRASRLSSLPFPAGTQQARPKADPAYTAPRLRGFKLDCLDLPYGTPGYPNGCVLRRRRCSRPRRVAPLLVVPPLRG